MPVFRYLCRYLDALLHWVINSHKLSRAADRDGSKVQRWVSHKLRDQRIAKKGSYENLVENV